MPDFEQKLDSGHLFLKVPRPGSVRVGVLGTVPALLRSYADESPEQILSDMGIDPGLLDYPENSIPFTTAGKLIETCAEKTGIPHFGLLIGQQVRPENIGQFADLAIYAPDVHTALRNMILHVCVHDRGGAPTFTRAHGTAILGYALYEHVGQGVKQINDTSLSVMCNLMRAMCGETWTPREIHFSHAQPKDLTPYENFFRAPLIFDADMDALLFFENWLEKRIPSANEQRFNFLLEQFKLLEQEMRIGLEEKVRALVRPLIVTRSCTHETIASMLAIHPRTLNRRMKNTGTTLRKVVSEMRFEIAKQMLLESEISVTELSTMVGYADSSTLARSFQRWAGSTPTEWRRLNKE